MIVARLLFVTLSVLAPEAALYAQSQPIPRAEAVTPGQAGAPAASPASQDRPTLVLDPDRKLQPGDQLSLTIVEDNDPVPLMKVVSAAGDIDIAPLGRVKIAGMSSVQASGAIKRFLDKDFYHDATVRLSVESVNVKASMGMIYLSGEVGAVGAQPIYADRPLTLSQAILNSGGVKKFGNDRKIKLTRSRGGSVETFEVDYKEIIEKGRVEKDMQLQDGDRIFVPTKLINF